MKVDMGIIASIMHEYSKLEPLSAYYRKDKIKFKYKKGFHRFTEEVIESVMSEDYFILDIGCGDGHTLINYATRFKKGIGVDDSEYIIKRAKHSSKIANVQNVEFQIAKAISLPFEDNTFNYIFSERGPLGHLDATLAEALRVLKPEGFIFIETLGTRNMEKYKKADGFSQEDTLLTSLEIERDRFQRYGILPTIMLSHLSTLQFDSLYDWFEYYCSIQRYLERSEPWRSDECFINNLLKNAIDKNGKISLTLHHIWIGGIFSKTS